MNQIKYFVLGAAILLLLFGCVNNTQKQPSQGSLDRLGDSDIAPQNSSTELTMPSESSTYSDSSFNETDVAASPENSDLILAGEDLIIEPDQ
ncbi:MAG: hypothetical protein ACP5N9_04255 [Candidatus Bilamarchaeum sp.]|jgi:uncharacterized lipoprotein